MDFFAQQARVRGSSRRLVALFVLAVVAIVVVIDAVVWFALGNHGVVGEPVVGHAPFLAEGDESVGAQEPELVAHAALVDARDGGQVADAQLLSREGAEDAVAGGVREELEALGGGLDFLWSRQGGLDARDGVGVHEAHLALAGGVD